MIHNCYEGMPSLVQILNERNPPLNAVIREANDLAKEMRAVREAQRQVFFSALPVAKWAVSKMLRVPAAEDLQRRRA